MRKEIDLQKVKRLTLALIVSGALNIFGAAFLVYWALYESPLLEVPQEKVFSEPAKKWSLVKNDELLRHYKTLSFEMLLPKLSKKGLVEDGFTERVLALGILVAYHDFDLQKALRGELFPKEKRALSFNQGKDQIIIFPGMTDRQFEAVENFAATEKWPFKSRGLFQLLQKERYKEEISLQEAFMLTPEFKVMQKFFAKTDKNSLLQMLRQSDWAPLAAFYENNKGKNTLSEEERQKLLFSYFKAGSGEAAALMLKTDFDFTTRRLSDATLLTLLNQLPGDTKELPAFLNVLIASPRGDELKDAAKKKYAELTGKKWEPLPLRATAPLIKASTMGKVMMEKAKVTPPKTSLAEGPLVKKTQDKIYTVQEGDSLWKIGKRFKVSVESLRALNKLKSDQLKPGTPLKIPKA